MTKERPECRFMVSDMVGEQHTEDPFTIRESAAELVLVRGAVRIEAVEVRDVIRLRHGPSLGGSVPRQPSAERHIGASAGGRAERRLRIGPLALIDIRAQPTGSSMVFAAQHSTTALRLVFCAVCVAIGALAFARMRSAPGPNRQGLVASVAIMAIAALYFLVTAFAG
jgi:hypothetical protein